MEDGDGVAAKRGAYICIGRVPGELVKRRESPVEYDRLSIVNSE
jgi:hypothetical protein